jgi:hypothetical protein
MSCHGNNGEKKMPTRKPNTAQAENAEGLRELDTGYKLLVAREMLACISERSEVVELVFEALELVEQALWLVDPDADTLPG